MKTCFKCGERKPLFDFYKHKKMADGHLNKCKTCAKKDTSDHRHGKGREKVLAYDLERAKQPKRVALRAEKTSQWRSTFPERKHAQSLLGSAVKSGTVIPWPVCALHECSAKPEAHHPDYDRPLDVVWLCSAHHKQAHALFTRLTASQQ